MKPLRRFGLAKGKKDVNMTTGSIYGHLISFSIPLLVGNIFQQLYNTVDAWVVGNYASDAAFSAVGNVGSVINMLIGFFVGLSGGAGVVISQYYGARQNDKVVKVVHTAAVMTAVLSVLFTVVGILMVSFMLNFMKMPDSVFPEAKTYLTIIFAGITGSLIYNMGSGILRAVGDSKRPFYFLVVSALVNTVLDLVFVLAFDMGVAGVAYATIIAQAVSAVLVILSLSKNESCIRISLSKLSVDVDSLKKILIVGIPAAIQTAITAFSNVFVQSYINFFGEDCMGGWTAYSKIDQVVLLPMQSIALASTTFVGQNLGNGDVKRARQGVNRSVLLSVICTALLTLPIMVFAPGLVAFFNDKKEVVEFGALFLRILSPFYIICCVNQVLAGALRGAGNSRACMVIMLTSFVAFRQVYLYIMANFISNTVVPISLAYPAGWIVCSTITLVYYLTVDLSKTRLVDKVGTSSNA